MTHKMKFFTVITLSLLSLSVFAASKMKQEYRKLKQTTNEKIEVLNTKLDAAKVKVSKFSGEAKEEMEDKYDELLKLKDDLKVKLSDARDVTEEKWQETKESIKAYASELEHKIDTTFN